MKVQERLNRLNNRGGNRTPPRIPTLVYCGGKLVTAHVTRERGFALCSRCAKRVRIAW